MICEYDPTPPHINHKLALQLPLFPYKPPLYYNAQGPTQDFETKGANINFNFIPGFSHFQLQITLGQTIIYYFYYTNSQVFNHVVILDPIIYQNGVIL